MSFRPSISTVCSPNAANQECDAGAAIETKVPVIVAWVLALEWALLVSGNALQPTSGLAAAASLMAIGRVLVVASLLGAYIRPQDRITRHISALAQASTGTLLITTMGFGEQAYLAVFPTLAIISLYQDWPSLITAWLTTVGIVGALTTQLDEPTNVISLAVWAAIALVSFLPGCLRAATARRSLARVQEQLDSAQQSIEHEVAQRTAALRQANEELAAQSAEAEKLALVARYTDNAVVITDQHSAIEWVNAGYTHMTGYTLKEVKGRRPAEFLHGPDTCPKTSAYMRDAVARREGFNTEIKNYRKNGEPYWLAIDVRPIRDRNGTVTRFIAIQSDITERKQMQLSLADAEARLRSIVNNVPAAFYRRQANDENRVLYVSPYIETLTGYRPEYFIGEPHTRYRELVHPGDADRLELAIQKAISNESEFEVKYRIVDREGQQRWVREKGQCRQLDVHGNSHRYVDGMLFDITDAVQAEVKNQQLHQDLLEASRRAGMAEIATGVLHNVGNVLNSVNVSAAVIQKQFDRSALTNLHRISDLISDHESEFTEFVAKDRRGPMIPGYIQAVTTALSTEQQAMEREFSELINNVAHIKSIVSIQQNLTAPESLQQDLSAETLLHEAVAAVRASLAEHNIPVEQHISADVPPFVSDRHRILQILVNLIKNAQDALLEHRPESPLVTIRVCVEQNSVLFAVQDNGIGIDNLCQERIFQHAYTTKKHGHGFGLHSAANAASELCGSLQVRSEGRGKGATFELRLPLHQTHVRL